MDESWRMRMGMNIPRRRSTEETSSDRMRRTIFGLEASDSSLTLKPEDFQDVFGGPPRSILFRQFSGELTEPSSVQNSVGSWRGGGGGGGGGGVGGFRRSDGFYDDIFGSDDDRRTRSRSKSESKSKSKSKSNSSSVLSSEDLSPLGPPIAEDVGFSSFASKLRPINIPCRWNSSSVTPEEQQKRNGISAIPCNPASYMDFHFTDSISHESFRSNHFGFSRRVPSPESIIPEPIPYQRTKMSVDNVEDTDSPRSAISSLYREPEAKPTIQGKELDDQEEDEVMSSYVIEITSNKMEVTDGVVDEAIAWAKEKFLTQSLEGLERGDRNNRDHYSEKEERRIKLDQRMDPAERMQFLTALEGPKEWTMGKGKLPSEKDVSCFP
ncbi:uncharacterized protein LOC122651113 [Telopea speciosissima]|uniref:uncharacterized protein LOC122651113 n=1 Tax=Telopea speciosissima TaxID=54955 RepID=UPI001CC59788|nr:uncharacterized protein LOC122651113 [Telopea speciosissima]